MNSGLVSAVSTPGIEEGTVIPGPSLSALLLAGLGWWPRSRRFRVRRRAPAELARAACLPWNCRTTVSCCRNIGTRRTPNPHARTVPAALNVRHTEFWSSWLLVCQQSLFEIERSARIKRSSFRRNPGGHRRSHEAGRRPRRRLFGFRNKQFAASPVEQEAYIFSAVSMRK